MKFIKYLFFSLMCIGLSNCSSKNKVSFEIKMSGDIRGLFTDELNDISVECNDDIVVFSVYEKADKDNPDKEPLKFLTMEFGLNPNEQIGNFELINMDKPREKKTMGCSMTLYTLDFATNTTKPAQQFNKVITDSYFATTEWSFIPNGKIKGRFKVFMIEESKSISVEGKFSIPLDENTKPCKE